MGLIILARDLFTIFTPEEFESFRNEPHLEILYKYIFNHKVKSIYN